MSGVRYLFEACRYQSCIEKGIVLVNQDNSAVFGFLTYFYNTDSYNRNGYLLLHSSKFHSSDQVPSLLIDELKLWLQSVDRPNAEIVVIPAA